MNTETVMIRCAGLRAALACAGKNDIRWYLNGVYLRATPQGTRIEATNGHLALFVWGHVEGHAADGLILYRDDLEAVLKLARKHELIALEITRSHDGAPSVKAVLPGLTRVIGVIDGRYPNTAPLLAGDLSQVTGTAISGRYLELLGDVATTLAEKSTLNCAQLDGQAPHGALWYTIGCAHGRAGYLVMPLRVTAKAPLPASTWPQADRQQVAA